MIGALVAEDKPCSTEQKQRCRFEWGEFLEWACENCEKNSSRHED
ncbi:MAG TPA: hypothetical protein PLR60_06530 [Syntrophorhabdaceae bacterium]|nr:hypothetical protein [Syntrophorhabdaceae bacterium]